MISVILEFENNHTLANPTIIYFTVKSKSYGYMDLDVLIVKCNDQPSALRSTKLLGMAIGQGYLRINIRNMFKVNIMYPQMCSGVSYSISSDPEGL